MARKPKPETETSQVVRLQAHLLSEAAKAGVPVKPETAAEVASALSKFSPADLTKLEAIADSPLALEALAKLAEENPEAFLRQYANLIEFSRPRLARTEIKADGPLAAVFVAVEQREAGPPAPARGKVIDHNE